MAKQILQPVGFTQRGRSRLWFADNGWWLVLVEFQPSSWSRGTYLNVAAKFLWSGDGVFSFDFSFGSSRIGTFCEFVDEKQFSVEVRRLAESAAKEAQRFHREFATMEAMADNLGTHVLSNPWGLYHAAAAAILAGRTEKARTFWAQLENNLQEETTEWAKNLQRAAGSLSSMSNEPANVVDVLAERVRHSRELLKLPEWKGQLRGGDL
ncbi:MAG TPA: hypothetical protein VGH50_04300 [Candidatus Binatia bacterium]